MIVQVPEAFLENPKILKLKNLTMLHYFNRKESKPIEVQINQHLLLHVFNGSKIIYENNKEFRVNAQESAFISRGHYIISEILSFKNSSFDGMMIFFDDIFLINFFSKYSYLFNNDTLLNDKVLNKLLIVEEASSLHDTMLSMNSYINQQASEALLQIKFEEILLQVLENDNSKLLCHYLINLYTKGVLNFKNIFDQEEFSDVRSMIKKSKLSEDKFRKLFFELYKLTPKEYLINKALTKAKHLLIEKKFNVSEVSLECSFNSLSWFIKQFKVKFGVTPKQFQQNYQKVKEN